MMKKEVKKDNRIKGKLFIISAVFALALSFIVPISNSTLLGIIGQHEIIIGNSVYAQGIEDYTCSEQCSARFRCK